MLRIANIGKFVHPGDIRDHMINKICADGNTWYNKDVKCGMEIMSKSKNAVYLPPHKEIKGFTIFDGILWPSDFTVNVEMEEATNIHVHTDNTDNTEIKRYAFICEKVYKLPFHSQNETKKSSSTVKEFKNITNTVRYHIDFTGLVKYSKSRGYIYDDVVSYLMKNKFYVNFDKFENGVYHYILKESLYLCYRAISTIEKSPNTIFNVKLETGLTVLSPTSELCSNKISLLQRETSAELCSNGSYKYEFSESGKILISGKALDGQIREFDVNANDLFITLEKKGYSREIVKEYISQLPIAIAILEINQTINNDNNTAVKHVCKTTNDNNIIIMEILNDKPIWKRRRWESYYQNYT